MNVDKDNLANTVGWERWHGLEFTAEIPPKLLHEISEVMNEILAISKLIHIFQLGQI